MKFWCTCVYSLHFNFYDTSFICFEFVFPIVFKDGTTRLLVFRKISNNLHDISLGFHNWSRSSSGFNGRIVVHQGSNARARFTVWRFCTFMKEKQFPGSHRTVTVKKQWPTNKRCTRSRCAVNLYVRLTMMKLWNSKVVPLPRMQSRCIVLRSANCIVRSSDEHLSVLGERKKPGTTRFIDNKLTFGNNRTSVRTCI